VEDSLAAFREAASADPADPRPLANLGRALLEMGRLEEAETAFRGALERNPANAAALEGLRRLRTNRPADGAR
jgi:cytochrome c-type biogenesis protein CcmH/NrfG